MAKKKAKATTPLKDRDDIQVPKKQARATFQEIVAAESDQTWIDDMAAMDEIQIPRIFTGWIDIDTLFAPTVGARIELSGPPSTGKSTASYKMMGTLLRTCRQCRTFAAEWLNEETGEILETCRCRKNDFMEGILVDLENAADAVYLNLWGCRTGVHHDVVPDPSGAFQTVQTQQKRLHILRPVTGGPMFTFIQRAVAKGAVDFVVVDAINSYITDEAWEKPAGKRSVGDRARMNWDGLRRVMAAQTEHQNKFRGRATIIWTNHLIVDVGSQWGGDVEAGGRGPGFFSDQKIRFLFSKTNEGRKEEPYDAVRETFFRVTKNRRGTIGGASGSFKMYINDMLFNRIQYRPGDTDDPDRMLSLLKDLGLFDETKSGYRVLGREFKRVMEIKDFLSREDIALECRFWIGMLRLPTIARAHLDPRAYLYTPFDEMRKFHERTAETIEKRFPNLQLSAAITDGEGRDLPENRPDPGGAGAGGAAETKTEFDALFEDEPRPKRRSRK